MWDYRVIRKRAMGPSESDEYTVNEAYYDENGEVTEVTEPSCSPFGTSKEDLVDDLSFYLEAFGKPSIDADTLEELSDAAIAVPEIIRKRMDK